MTSRKWPSTEVNQDVVDIARGLYESRVIVRRPPSAAQRDAYRTSYRGPPKVPNERKARPFSAKARISTEKVDIQTAESPSRPPWRPFSGQASLSRVSAPSKETIFTAHCTEEKNNIEEFTVPDVYKNRTLPESLSPLKKWLTDAEDIPITWSQAYSPDSNFVFLPCLKIMDKDVDNLAPVPPPQDSMAPLPFTPVITPPRRPYYGSSGDPAMGQVETLLWVKWRPCYGSSGDPAMGLVETLLWVKWRPCYGSSGDPAMGQVETLLWVKWRPCYGSSGDPAMGLVETLLWWRPCYGSSGDPAMGLVETLLWVWWRPCYGSSGDPAMGLVETLLWVKWRPCYGSSGDPAMGLVETLLWVKWRPCYGSGGDPAMGLVETLLWVKWRPCYGFSGDPAMGQVETLLWVKWRPCYGSSGDPAMGLVETLLWV
ncbi:predicted protein [Nematostella vectensis]|uniref:Uncharacterized protein n=1 Tax=Nematostella vectensis TaxID=45351 RepID=A7SMN8_NEMVE|nr:predicted protein [Nematostella vectensis]|eukprot:XP_001627103.1 predicted protein [Nematostella vectensis]